MYPSAGSDVADVVHRVFVDLMEISAPFLVEAMALVPMVVLGR